MAGIIAGLVEEGFKGEEINAFISTDLNEYTEAEFAPTLYLTQDNGVFGPYSKFRSAPQTRQQLLGSVSPSFLQDYYYRVHINPKAVSLGNMLAAQTITVEVWNAYLTPQLLSSISSSGTEGLTLTGPFNTPTTLAAMEPRNYTLSVSIIGPPVIDGEYAFNFPSKTPKLEVSGRRVVVWPFIPQTKHAETMEWLTDIIPSYNSEQRLALRPEPRQSFKYDFQLTEREFSLAKAISTQWAHRVYGVPVWAEVSYVGALSAGATAIFFDTAFADYRENDIILVWESSEKYEAVETLTVLSDRINLKLPLPNAYSAAYVAPLRFARTMQGMDYARRSDPYVQAKGTFIVTNNKDLGATVGYPVYRGKDVIVDRTVIVSSINERISRQIDIFDNGSGPIEVEQKNNLVSTTSIMTFDTTTRQERWNARKWIHSRRGKQKGFWLPSWNADLVSLVDVTSASNGITCLPIGYSTYYGVKDIMIQLKNGTRLFNRILSATIDGGGNEVLSLENTVGVNLPVADIDFICFMAHVRFNSDRIEMTYSHAARTSLSVPVIEIPE